MGGALKILGYFPSAEEAALCYSRYLGRGLAREMANLAGQGDRPPTAEEVWATAEAEGVDLNDFRSERNQYLTLVLALALRLPLTTDPGPDPNPGPGPNLTLALTRIGAQPVRLPGRT